MAFGFAFKSKDFSDSARDIRLLRGDNIGQGRLRWTNVKGYPQHRVHEVDRYLLRQGDVVIAMDRPWIEAGLKFAVVRQADTPSLLVQRVTRLRAKEGLDQGYLAAVIASRQFTEYVIGVQTGSAVPHMSGGQIAAFPMPELPTLAEQRDIAATLGALDDKIESNRRAIRLMEELGAALLDAQLQLDVYGFPNYDDRSLGGMLSVVETGARPRGGAGHDSTGVVSLGAESVQSAGVIATSQFKRVPIEHASSMRRGRLTDGDVLVYKDGGTPGIKAWKSNPKSRVCPKPTGSEHSSGVDHQKM